MAEESYTTEYVFRIQIEGEEALRQAQQIRRQLGDALAGRVGVQEYARVSDAMRRISESTGPASAAVQQFAKAAVEGEGAAERLTEQLVQQKKEAWIPLPTDVRKATGAMDAFQRAINRATLQYFGLRRLTFQMTFMGRAVERMGQQILGALSRAQQAYLDMEYATTRAAAAMDLPVEMTEELQGAVLDTSVAMGFLSPEDVAEGLRIWAAGTGAVVTSTGELNEFLQSTIDIQKLAIINNENLGAAMEYVGAILRTYGMSLGETARVTEVLNYAAARSFAEVSDMGQAFRFIGPIVDELGVGLEETAAALMVMADAGIRGSMAGRALRQVLIRLVKPTKEVDAAMSELLGYTLELGETWQDLVFPSGEFAGLAEYVDLLAASTENLTSLEREAYLATVTTANALPGLIALVDRQIEARERNINALRAYSDLMRGVSTEETERFRGWIEDITGVAFSMEDAADVMSGQWERMADSSSRSAQQIAREWQAALAEVGSAIKEWTLGPLRTVAGIMRQLMQFFQRYPEVAIGALAMGASAAVIGALTRVAASLATMAINVTIWRVGVREFAAAVGVFNKGVATFTATQAVKEPAEKVGLLGLLGLGPGGAAAIGTGGWAVLGLTALVGKTLELAVTFEILTAVIERLFELVDEMTGGWVSRQREVVASSQQLAKAQDLVGESADRALGRDRAQQFRDIWESQKLGLEVLDSIRKAFNTLTWSAGVARDKIDEVYASIMGLPSTKQMTIYLDYVQRRREELMPMQVDPSEFARRRETELWPTGVQLTEQQKRLVEAYEAGTEHSTNMANIITRANEALAEQEERYQTQRLEATRGFADRYAQMFENRETTRRRAAEDHQIRMEQMEESHGIQMASIAESYAARVADIKESYEARVVRIKERYATQEAKAAESHSDRMAKLSQRYNDRVADYEEDFRKKMERMELDHQTRMSDLIVQRDARGLLNEMRSYRRRVREANQDRADWLRRAQRDYQRQIAEQQKALTKQRRDREAAMKKALEDAEKNYKKQLEDAKEQYEKQIRQANANYARQARLAEEAEARAARRREEDFWRQLEDLVDALEDQLGALEDHNEDRVHEIEEGREEELTAERIAFAKRLAEIFDLYQEDTRLLARHLEWNLDLYRQYWSQVLTMYQTQMPFYAKLKIPWEEPTPPPRPYEPGEPYGPYYPRQAGGYAYFGRYLLGEEGPEFVLNAPTTRALERSIGRLSQERIVSFAEGGRRAIVLHATVNQRDWHFEGSFTEEERVWFQDTSRQIALETMDDVITAVAG